jgi:hypothetical protein
MAEFSFFRERAERSSEARQVARLSWYRAGVAVGLDVQPAAERMGPQIGQDNL